MEKENEEKCKWYLDSESNSEVRIGCGDEETTESIYHDIIKGFSYCPYCGKEIELSTDCLCCDRCGKIVEREEMQDGAYDLPICKECYEETSDEDTDE